MAVTAQPACAASGQASFQCSLSLPSMSHRMCGAETPAFRRGEASPLRSCRNSHRPDGADGRSGGERPEPFPWRLVAPDLIWRAGVCVRGARSSSRGRCAVGRRTAVGTNTRSCAGAIAGRFSVSDSNAVHAPCVVRWGQSGTLGTNRSGCAASISWAPDRFVERSGGASSPHQWQGHDATDGVRTRTASSASSSASADDPDNVLTGFPIDRWAPRRTGETPRRMRRRSACLLPRRSRKGT